MLGPAFGGVRGSMVPTLPDGGTSGAYQTQPDCTDRRSRPRRPVPSPWTTRPDSALGVRVRRTARSPERGRPRLVQTAAPGPPIERVNSRVGSHYGQEDERGLCREVVPVACVVHPMPVPRVGERPGRIVSGHVGAFADRVRADAGRSQSSRQRLPETASPEADTSSGTLRGPAIPTPGIAPRAVALAQPAEHRIVDPKVMGSTPIGHPNSPLRAPQARRPERDADRAVALPEGSRIGDVLA